MTYTRPTHTDPAADGSATDATVIIDALSDGLEAVEGALAGKAATAHAHTLADVSDAGGAAALEVGTTTGTVAAGDDSRIVGAVQASTYDAHSILAATTDNTPAAVTVAEQRLVGRITGGNIDDLTPEQIAGVLGTGTPSASTFLRGDQTWAAPAGGDPQGHPATVPIGKSYGKVGLPGHRFIYGGNFTPTTGYLFMFPFWCGVSTVVDSLDAYVETLSADATVKACLYSFTTYNAGTTPSKIANTEVTITVTSTGAKTMALPAQTTLAAGLYAVGLVSYGGTSTPSVLRGLECGNSGWNLVSSVSEAFNSGAGARRSGLVCATGQTSLPSGPTFTDAGVGVALTPIILRMS